MSGSCDILICPAVFCVCLFIVVAVFNWSSWECPQGLHTEQGGGKQGGDDTWIVPSVLRASLEYPQEGAGEKS